MHGGPSSPSQRALGQAIGIERRKGVLGVVVLATLEVVHLMGFV